VNPTPIVALRHRSPSSHIAETLVEKARVPGVAFQSMITVPVVEGKNISGVPIGCETIKTTTVQSGAAPPWTVAIAPGVKAIAIGGCTPIRLDLRDASGKEWPRNPAGQLLSLADFDMAVTSPSRSAIP
jgi:hypothetical protein